MPSQNPGLWAGSNPGAVKRSMKVPDPVSRRSLNTARPSRAGTDTAPLSTPVPAASSAVTVGAPKLSVTPEPRRTSTTGAGRSCPVPGAMAMGTVTTANRAGPARPKSLEARGMSAPNKTIPAATAMTPAAA